MTKKQLENRLKSHVHEPKPKQFFEMIEYQCGCGLYFTKEQYFKYCRQHNITPILTVKELRESRSIGI